MSDRHRYKPISLRADPRILDKLQALADKKGMYLQEYIRWILAAHVEKMER